MGNIMSTGQITLIDLTDERVSSFYLQANQSKTQVYDVNAKTYSPDYTSSPNLTITPLFFFGNEDNSSKLSSSNLTYTINGVTVNSTFNGASQRGNQLIIAKNINSSTVAPFNTDTLKITAIIAENTVTDDTTGITIEKVLTADIELIKVNTGTNGTNGSAGVSVVKVEQQYMLSTDPNIAPDTSNEKWSTTNPTWQQGNYLWIRTKITYSDNGVEYTSPYCDSSWKAAADGVAGLNKDIDSINSAMNKMQAEIDGAIETWYLPGDPTAADFKNPWKEEEGDSSEVREKHIGDLYFDTNTGKSYRYFKDGSTYKWQIISDQALSQAIADISNLRTDVDNKVKIFYGNKKPSNPSVDDMWIKDDGSFWQCIRTDTGTDWVLSSYSIETVEVQYSWNTSNTVAPTENWSTSSPEWQEGRYIWQRTKTTYKGGVKQPDYSEPVCISAAAARGITVSGEQVFKSTDGTNYTPDTITLTANSIGGLTVGGWYYKDGTSWKSLNTSANSIYINSSHTAFGTGTVATIKVVSAQDSDYYDIISLYKVADGQKGADGKSTSSVFLTNENITFAANAAGQVAAKTATCNVVALTGTTKVKPVVSTISKGPSGMHISTGSYSDNEIPIIITVDPNSTLGGPEEQNGTIEVSITSPVSTTLKINWSKVNNGPTGAKGEAGADAIFAVVESTSGKLVFTDSDSSPITLRAYLNKGGAIQTSNVTYSWRSVPEGISEVTTQTLTVSRDQVPSARSFVCTITYGGKTYTDSIALSDKTDAIYCNIESSAGDKFTNGNITTILKCRVFNAYGEVDIDTENTKYIYTWEKYVNGVKDENWRNAGKYVGKTVEITSNDVSAKATFSCTVTKAT